MHTHINTCTHVCITYLYIYIHTQIYIYICAYVYTYYTGLNDDDVILAVFSQAYKIDERIMYAWVRALQVCMHVCVHVYMYVSMYACAYA